MGPARRARGPRDESEVRIRPNPRGTRPRSKERPRHDGATPAWVIAIDRGRFTCLAEPGAAGEREVVAMKARELARDAVVVGDRVSLVGDVSGAPDSLARVVRVEPRRTALRRSAEDTGTAERTLVANADVLGIVTALAEPEPRPRMVDRCLVAAYDAGLQPLLILTKADLADAGAFLASYAVLDVPYVVTSAPTGPAGPIHGLADVVARLGGRVSVLVGHSGVGKSTMVNALVPGARRATGGVNDVTGRGRHTSTSARALRLPGGGWVIDTPGVRSFGLAHVEPDRIVRAFPDLAAGTGECPRGCSHDEPECGLDEFVASGGAGAAGPGRLDSLRRLLRSRAGADDDRDGVG